MKMNMRFIVVMAIVSVFVAGPAFAFGPGACSDEGRKACFKEKKENLKKELNLTAEQDKMLTEAKDSHRAEMETLMKAIKDKRDALKEAIARPGVTRKSLEPIIADMKVLESQMVDHRIDGILKVKSILSPEQFQKLEKMKEGWHKGPKGQRGHKGPRMGPPSED